MLVKHVNDPQYHNYRPVAAEIAKIFSISGKPRIEMVKDIIAIVEAKIAQPKVRLRPRNAQIGEGAKEFSA